MVKAMRRTEHTIARVVTLIGLVASCFYLFWRALFLAGTDLWLSIPVLLVEMSGFVGGALLVWALWPHLARQSSPAESVVSAVDVLVRVHHQGEHELRATLMALRAVANVSDIIIVDISARPSIASIAAEFQHMYAVTDAGDCSGVATGVGAVRTPRFLLLDAGDVPTTDIVSRLTRAFVDERVAVVQGLGVSFATDSIEHGPHGRHDLTFERGALNPALGARGCAVWTGSGSLVAVDALREALADSLVSATLLEIHWAVTAELMSAGWRIAAPSDVAVLAHRVEHSGTAVHADRRARVRAARRLVARGRTSYSARQRLAIWAWCVRPLSGLRRAAFIGVLVCAIYSGSIAFSAPLWLMLAAWLPGFVATSVGLCLLSGWRLRPGDRARWSLASMGPAGAQFGVGLISAITAICLVLVVRGLSDQFTHALGRMPRESLEGLIAVALWTLALSLDVLHLLARRTRKRRTARVASLLPAVFGERSAKIVDLTAHGAGLLSQTALARGQRALLVSTITTASGVTEIRVPCVVGSVTAIDTDSWRLGVMFGEVNNALANALSEFCTVEPMWERLGVMPETSVTEARRMEYVQESDDAFVGRGMLRFLSIVALVGAVVSSVSGNFDATRSSTRLLIWSVIALAGLIGGSLLLGLARPRAIAHSANALPSNSGSSFSPDLAIK